MNSTIRIYGEQMNLEIMEHIISCLTSLCSYPND